MGTQPAPLDPALTVSRETIIWQLTKRLASLLRQVETANPHDAAYAQLLADNVDRVGACVCDVIREAINPSEQERALAAANPWLDEIRGRLEEAPTRTARNEDGTTQTVITEWVLDDEAVIILKQQADKIVAKTMAIDSARHGHRCGAAKAPAILYADKLEDLDDKPMPKRCLGPWIDFPSIRQWLEHCDVHHASHCQLSPASKAIFTHHPRWLIDVERRCLVEARPGQRYLALSYVWGARCAFRTLKSNLAAVQRDGALMRLRPLLVNKDAQRPSITDIETLSHTVADVIEFADQLGEQYLWVDALCIVQDDENDKQEHLAHMGSIYANAYATVAVVNGPASAGLRGIQNITAPMRRERYSVHRPGSMASAVERQIRKLKDSQWNQRAWTFQEQIFSRRLLILDDTDVTWECHCNVWLEGVRATEPQCARSTATVATGFSFHIEPTFSDYAVHIAQYNKRQLAYPEDSMDAFAGILTVLQRTFQGGFICCLPVMFFDTALLWYNEGAVEPRVPLLRHSGKAPSWSWAAYSGKVAFPDFPATMDGVRPLVRWQYCQSSQTGWVPVASLEKQQPERKSWAADQLHRLVNTMSLQNEGIAPGREPHIPKGLICHHLLHARPERAVFNALEFYGSEGVPVAGVSGRCAGVLTPCQDLSSQSLDDMTGMKCELVAVSECVIGDSTMYNVLWIGKRRGIYHRKGVGRIPKSTWVTQNPQRVDLLLM